MKVEIHINKGVEENAGIYFDKAKKLKGKLVGIEETLTKTAKQKSEIEKELREAEKKSAEEVSQIKEDIERKAKKEWYEKFRWFISSEGFLCVGGKDATSNEIVVKKHTEKDDIVFHTDMAGSPFFVIKSEGKKIGKATMDEVAIATASFSRAWRLGLTTLDVFHVKPDQVTKKAKSGEFMPKGAFMVYGKTTYHRPEIQVSIGMTEDNKIMAGPLAAVSKHCKRYVSIEEGREKTSAVAKKIQKVIGGHLDDIIRPLPSGGSRIKK